MMKTKARHIPKEKMQQKVTGTRLFMPDNRSSAIAQLQLQKIMKPENRASLQHPKNNTGLPDTLKTGIENLSGIAMDDVNVHYNSLEPAQLQAHAYAQGTDIHVAPGQEKHLPHEAWHVVQQKQRRVKPTLQMKPGTHINDNTGLEKEADVMGRDARSNGKQRQSHLKEISISPSVSLSIIQGVFINTGGFSWQDLDTKNTYTQIEVRVDNRLKVSGHGEEFYLEYANGKWERSLDDELSNPIKKIKKEKNMQEKEYIDMEMNEENQKKEVLIKIVEKEDYDDILIKDNLTKRIEKWKNRLSRRDLKSSTAFTKRQKQFNATGKVPLLTFTHTAPPKINNDNSYHQGKDVTPTQKTQFNYFRTGENKQSEYFKVDKKKKYIFIKEIFDFYKELDTGVKFETEETKDLKDGLITASKPNRFTHSGYGSEVNAYTKLKILEQQKEKYKGEEFQKTEEKAEEYINTSEEKESKVGKYITKRADPHAKFEESYISAVLEHARGIVEKLKDLKLNNFTMVVRDEKSGFLLYPSLIIEPKSNKKLTTKDIEPHMNKIIEKFNANSKIKLYLRNSFGFLYPTISDLERSIRIWPGQLDPDYFYEKMAGVLTSYDDELSPKKSIDKKTVSEESSMEFVEENLISSNSKKMPSYKMLFATLDRVMLFIKKIYETSKGFKPDEKTRFLHQRMVSNLEKANIFKLMRLKGDYWKMDAEDVFLEITQVIDNLNEFGFQLIEQQKWTPTKENFEWVVSQSYAPFIKAAGFVLTGATLTQSGMQAGMVAMNIKKSSIFDLGPSYFEFPGDSMNDNFKKDKKEGKTGHYDPAYNFTSSEDVETYKKVSFTDTDHACIIADITNVKPSEITGVLKRHSKANTIYLYGSLSKHFQLGMDRFTLGILLEIKKNEKEDSQLQGKNYHIPEELLRYFIIMQDTHNEGLEHEIEQIK